MTLSGRPRDPDAAVLAFLESTYEAAADLGGWDRRRLRARRASRPDSAQSLERGSLNHAPCAEG